LDVNRGSETEGGGVTSELSLEADVHPSDVLERARALRPMLREQQAEAEVLGRHTDAVQEEFAKAGLYRILAPRQFGGYELDMTTYLTAMKEISRGDPGSGWMLTLASCHWLMVGSWFSKQAQTEMFEHVADSGVAHRVVGARTTCSAVDGGYVVSGQWDYCSGIPFSSWLLGNTTVPGTGPDDPPRELVLAIPRSDFTILDDWGDGDVLGMQASGSNGVTVNQAFVPEHLAVPYTWYDLPDPEQPTPGTELHGNPMFLGRVVGFYHAELASVIVGSALAALDEYEEIIRTKPTLLPPRMLRYEHHDHQQTFGQATSLTEAAEAILHRVGDLYMEHCQRWAETGEPFDLAKDARLMGMAQQAARIAADAVDLLFYTAGSSAAKRGSRLQRYFRDVATYRGHITAQRHEWAWRFARVYMGLADEF
jgi:3-hydroxy-9,10-secoandrosta-1,3,5(10)-triene-9,17-dione monooxygenase